MRGVFSRTNQRYTKVHNDMVRRESNSIFPRNLNISSYQDLGAPRPSRQYLLFALRITRIVVHFIGRITRSPCLPAVAQGDPDVVFASAGVVSSGSFDGLAEANEEWAQDGNGAENDDEPHFRQHPGVQ